MIPTVDLESFVISSASIPASSDAAKLFPVFAAAGRPMWVSQLSYYGGDSGEYAQFILVPPTVVINGTTGIADHPGCIALSPAQYLAGGEWTQAKPNTIGADNGGRGTSWWGGWIIPPNYQIAIQQDTANTAAWECIVGAFEIGR